MPYDIELGRDSSDKKLFKERGFAFIGKGYVKMGQYTSLSNRILLDVVRSHVILVAGKRGGGKSYTLGVIAEELSNLPEDVRENVGSLIFDTMGIYWTMKFPNEKDKELLYEWKLESKKLPVKIFVPYGFYDDYLEKGIKKIEKEDFVNPYKREIKLLPRLDYLFIKNAKNIKKIIIKGRGSDHQPLLIEVDLFKTK